MISIRDLRSGILSIEDLGIAPGVTSVIGANGSGKTSLLKILAGISNPEAGTVLVDGIPPRDCEIGWLGGFPDRNLLFSRVTDEIASPLRFRRMPEGIIRKRVRDCMDMLGISALAERRVQELSGGEKVMVALGAALIAGPGLLILDECDSHLDISRAAEVERLIRASGIRYIMQSTQQMDAAARSDSLVFMENGRIAHAGTPEDVFGVLADTAFYPLSWKCRL